MAIPKSLVKVGLRVSYTFRNAPPVLGTVSEVLDDGYGEITAKVTWDGGSEPGLFVNSSITGEGMRYYEHIEAITS